VRQYLFFFIPIAIKLSGINPITYKWSIYSILLTVLATVISIIANICLYLNLQGNNHSGSSSMMIALYPVVTLLLSVVFLNEQLSVLKMFGIASMILGAVLLSR